MKASSNVYYNMHQGNAELVTTVVTRPVTDHTRRCLTSVHRQNALDHMTTKAS